MGGVEILVGEWLEDEGRVFVARHGGRVIVCCGVTVDQLASVVGVVARLLHPEPKVMVQITAINELGIAAPMGLDNGNVRVMAHLARP